MADCKGSLKKWFTWTFVTFAPNTEYLGKAATAFRERELLEREREGEGA